MGSREHDQNNSDNPNLKDNEQIILTIDEEYSRENTSRKQHNELLIKALVIITGEGSKSMAINSASNPFSSGNPFSNYLNKQVAHLPKASEPNQLGLTRYVGVGERKPMTNHEALEHLINIREAFPEGTQNRNYVEDQLAQLKSDLEEPFKKLAKLGCLDTSQTNTELSSYRNTSNAGHLI